MQGAAGMLMTTPEDVHRLADACRSAGILLICDEVATGFGRSGALFASAQCGISPDLLCLGKGLTGGYLPMSVTVASQRVYDAFLGPDLGERDFYHGQSYGGNALTAAVALRHLQLLEDWPGRPQPRRGCPVRVHRPALKLSAASSVVNSREQLSLAAQQIYSRLSDADDAAATPS